MSTARPADEETLADALGSARFVRVLAGRDGDSLAAAGLLARACDARNVPFQVRPGTDAGETGDAVTVAVGVDADADYALADRPAALAAYETARGLGTDPDPVLALAGVVAAGQPASAGDAVLQAAEATGRVRRRPGVAVPTADLGDGLAYSTLLHAPVSGDVEGVRATLAELDLPAELDEDAHRRVASLVAVDVAGAEGATPRAATAVERALRPFETPDAPFETVGGYADVLDAAAREAPGVGVALALGADVRVAALEAWREHAGAAHRLLRAAETSRRQGLSVARVPADADAASTLPTVARLFRDFRAPEETVLVVADWESETGATAGAAAMASVDDDVSGTIRAAADSVGGDARPAGDAWTARFETDASRFTDAVREARE